VLRLTLPQSRDIERNLFEGSKLLCLKR